MKNKTDPLDVLLGTVARGDAIGKTATTRWTWYMVAACIDCGERRWVALRNKHSTEPRNRRCQPCSTQTEEHKVNSSKAQAGRRREQSPFWKGGRTKIDGYWAIYLSPESLFFSMAVSSRREYGGYVKGAQACHGPASW